jgi:hypothetical protein
VPAPEFRDRFQAAVLWMAFQPTKIDDYGVIAVDTPIQVRVCWKDSFSETQLPDGSTVTLDGTAKVWQYIPIGSRIWLGTLEQWYGGVGTGSGSPSPGRSADDSEVRVVKVFTKIPDPKNRNQGYSIGFMRWKNSG